MPFRKAQGPESRDKLGPLSQWKRPVEGENGRRGFLPLPRTAICSVEVRSQNLIFGTRDFGEGRDDCG